MKNAISNMFRVRLLPSVAVTAAALLLLKLASISVGLDAVMSGIQPVYAQGAAHEEASAAAGEHGGGVEEAPAEHGAPLASTGHGASPEGEGQAPEFDPSLALTPEQFDHPSVAETRLLRSLADRRRELDARERDIALQGRLLEASERRVESRIEELKGIEARIEELFGVEEEAQEQQLTSLVTMYQSMKPKDAARILGQLDMDILVKVVRRMSERKMAPILAAMDPVAAQELTVELVTGGGIPDDFDVSVALEEAPPAP